MLILGFFFGGKVSDFSGIEQDDGLQLKRNFPLHEEDRLAGEEDAGGVQGDVDGAAAGGELAGDHGGLPQLLSPEGGEVGVGAAGDGVFGDVQLGVEAAGDEVVAPGGGGDDEPPSIDLAHGLIVRDQGRQGLLGVDDDHHVAAVVIRFPGEAARRGQNGFGHRHGLVRAHGKVHRIAFLARPDDQFAAQGVEVHFLHAPVGELVEDEGGGEGGVAAERHLAAGGEPFQVVPAFAALDDEGGFGVVVLDGDGLHEGRRRHSAAREDARRVAGEEGVREGVHKVLNHRDVRFCSATKITNSFADYSSA